MSITSISTPIAPADLRPLPSAPPPSKPATAVSGVEPVASPALPPASPVLPPSSGAWNRADRKPAGLAAHRSSTTGEVPRTTSEEWRARADGANTGGVKGKEKEEGSGSGEEKENSPLGRAVQQMNETLRVFKREVGFKIVLEDGETYVEVFDKNTEKTIRRMPPEDLLHKIERIKNDLGYIIDEQG